jgi:hypothetical protein
VRQSRTSWPLILTLSSVAVATPLALRIGAPPAATPVGAPATPPIATVSAQVLSDEALTLYAAGDFAPACDRFSRAAAAEPASPARASDVASCFETWAWRALGERRGEVAK